MPVVVALGSVAVLILVAIAAPLASRRPAIATPVVYGTSGLAALVLFVTALAALLGHLDVAGEVVLPLGLPWVGAHFRIDPLSAFFLVVVDLGAATASLYALGYGAHEDHPERVLPFYPAFLAGMNLVILSADAFSFLVGWEFMSLASWALVMAHHHEEENRRAGYVYLVMASFGTLMLLLAFGLMAGPDGVYAFAEMGNRVREPWLPGLVLVLALLGAGSKAGLVPLHVWLPLAHPAAPSHVSALMSGVMTKVAVYGFVRIVFDLVGEPVWWWSAVVMGLGALTAVLGVLHAILERDFKRLLAYSTVENIGIVFIGLGLALAFRTNEMAGPAALAVTAALFHALNHSLFKGLMFFGAGAVLTATGERDIEKLGGLIHRLPVTAFFVLGGAVAISALPPLNGFVSEWMIFQAILLSPDLPQWALKFMVPAVGAALAFSAALAGACFVRAYGVAFLGRPRSAAAAEAREVDILSRTAMALLLGLCLLAGIVPGLVIDAASSVAIQLVGHDMPPQPLFPSLSIVPVSEGRSSYSGMLVFIFILISSGLVIWAIHRFASKTIRRGPAWDCGFPDASPATQYTADSFAMPIRRVFGPVAFGSYIERWMPPPGDPSPARLKVVRHDLPWEILYAPISGRVSRLAERLNTLQFLSIRSYLSLVFAALVGLLVVVAIWA
ncbi:MAG: hydrogenase 4 subunit B [Siculibacillus sp.]|nr:hydrogenase 4 subunit B [Siculibacillus sp.]